MQPLVLVAEDERVLADSICVYLERHGFATTVARAGDEAVRVAEEAGPEVAVVDLRLPGIDGIEVLRRVGEVSPGTEVVIMTAHGTVAAAVRAMKLGAFDYLTKPLDLDELRLVVDRAVAHLRIRRELSYLKAQTETGFRLSEMIGESPPLVELRRQIERVAVSESARGPGPPPILIVGETGAGKETAARAIHYRSPRAAGPFLQINCAATPSPALEAELFGHEKGAYAGARTAKPGLFEAAEGGTLFLDEIGSMEPAIQAKLLAAIEEKFVRRLGGRRTKAFNARIITATHLDLEVAVAQGAFHSGLYATMKAQAIRVPPLRVRGDDVILLARHFLDRFSRQRGLPRRELSPEAEARLRTYPWPGNIRELAHVTERAVLLYRGPMVRAEHLGLSGVPEKPSVVVHAGGDVVVDFGAGGIVLEEVERQLIVEALRATGWNRARAAQLLGISKETLRYRTEKYRLRSP